MNVHFDRLNALIGSAVWVESKFKLAAAVYDKSGALIGSATNNMSKSHPWQERLARAVGHPDKIFLHAEVAALLKSKGGDPNVLYVARIKKDGTTGLSKPCDICMEAMRLSGVEEYYYTINDTEIGCGRIK